MIRNITKIKDLIQEHKLTRGTSDEFLLNSLSGMFSAILLMHSCLDKFRSNKKIILEAKRNYVISLAGILETFYKDLFIYILEKDKTALETILSNKNDDTYKLKDLYELVNHKISFAELAAYRFSFQDIGNINNNISLLNVFQNDYFTTLQEHNEVFFVPSIGKLTKIALPQNWQKMFNAIFTNRHSLVHNRNKSCEISNTQMSEYELLVCTIIQLTANLITQKYDPKSVVMTTGHPVFFSVNCMMLHDYCIASDSDTIAMQIKSNKK